MKLGLRIFGAYLLIFTLCFSAPIAWVLDSLRVRYLEGVEDPLTDQANILAVMVARDMADHRFNRSEYKKLFERIYARRLDAQIYNLAKTQVDIRVYITDAQGKVIFDSLVPDNLGADYSHWRDVKLTLAGEYGARTTLANPSDPNSSALFVAAPVLAGDRVEGVLTVAKPTTNINSFLKAAKPQIVQVVLMAALVAVVLSYLAALWFARPIGRLRAYAEAIHDGRPAVFPPLDHTEIGDMGRALQKMQTALEGKAYIEQYVQKLTHEIKSPLSAIRGAAELLEEDVPAERRRRFLTNIRTEANRIQIIVDRMLELAALETRKQPLKRDAIVLRPFVETVVESKRPMLSQKQISLELHLPDRLSVHGDPFLLHQAMANLVQNAIDFSAAGSRIDVSGSSDGQWIELVVEDNGATIPPYALAKVFDKFFSLQRPDSGKKSTGLGLSLVREIAHLHQGQINLENRDRQGVRATLRLPAGYKKRATQRPISTSRV